MKTKNTMYMMALAVLLCWSCHAFGQTKVTGRVIDQTGVLQGASLHLDKTASSSLSDYDGNFQLLIHTLGEQYLTIRYVGYRDSTIFLDIKQHGHINLGDILLNNGTSQELDHVVVSGVYRPSQLRALQIKKAASNIVETLAADAIGKLPDRNAAEAVQRMQGVSIERDMGEGRFVSVRGTPIQWSASTLNGNRLPSASGDNAHRGLQMDIFPSEIIQFVKMAKAITPNMDGDAIGGSIDFITRSSVSKQTFSINGSGGYVDQSRKPSYNTSVVYGNKITDKLSFIGTGVIWDRSSGLDNYQMVFDFNNPDTRQSFAINQLQLRDYVARRRTMGFNGAFDYQFNDHHHIFLKGLYSQYLDQQNVRETYFNFNQNSVNLQARHADYLTDLYNIQLGGKSRFTSKTTFDWSIYHARSSFAFDSPKHLGPNERGYPIVNFTQPMEYLQLADDGKRYQHKDWPDGGLDPKVVLPYTGANIDPDALRLHQIILQQNKNSEKDLAFKFDVHHQLTENLTIQGGLKGLHKRKNIRANTLVWMPASSLGIPDSEIIPLSSLETEPFPANGGFLTELDQPFDHVLIDQITNKQIDQLYTDDIRSRYQLLPVQDANTASNIASSFTGREQVYAGYVMADWSVSDHFTLLAGVRNEYNDIRFDGYKATSSEGATEKEPVNNKHQYHILLPMLHTRWEINEQTILRAALTRSFARPDFNSLNPGTIINDISNTITEGNTFLKPTISNNADLMFEHYLHDVGLISAGVFYKDLRHIIYDNQSVVTVNDKLYVKSNPENLDRAKLLGFELGVSKRFTELPGLLSKLGIELNYSFVDSKMDLPQYTNGELITVLKTTLPKQAKHIFNSILFYEDGKFMARIAGNYKGNYLNAIRSQAGPEHYQWFDKNFTMDFSSSYALRSNLRLFLELNNITNAPNRFYHGSKDRIENISYAAFRGQLGLSFNLK